MTILKTSKVAGPGGTNAIDGSVSFDTTSYLALASGALISGYGFGVDDFTIEFWIKQGVNSGNYVGLFAATSSTSADRFEVAIHSSTIQVYTDTGAWRDTSYAPVSGQWEHIAFVRNYSGNTLKMYANGIEKWSVSNTHDYNEVFTTQIGWHGSTYPKFQGFISNLRVLKGVALYTSAFTPPTEKLTAVPGTILLCCQDSDDPTQEATGKTITGYGTLASVGVNENLVTNGNFTRGTTGWDDSLAPSSTTLTSENQRLKIVASGGTGRARQEVTGLTIGNRYKFQIRHVTCASGNCFTHLGTSSGGAEYIANLGIGDEDLHTFYFTATATSAWIQIGITNGLTGYYDDVSITLAEQSKEPKDFPSVGKDDGTVLEGDITFDSLNYMTLPKGNTSQRGRGRGLWAGGTTGTASNIIQYAELSTEGNTLDFGDLSAVNDSAMATASATRAVFGGGRNHPSYYNKIEFVTIATTSNVTDFGDLTVARQGGQGCGNQTRGIFGPGVSPAGSPTSTINTIDYVTIATLGDATDFGDFTEIIRVAALSSPTRGLFAGGYGPSSPNMFNTIQYITIATTGNAQDFGDMSTSRMNMSGGGCASNTRGLFAGGVNLPSVTGYNLIDFVTIATTGNSTDFGDLTVTGQGVGANSNNLRGVFGGRTNPSKQNVIDYVDIATTGNAKDFGDLLNVFANLGGTSDSNGGLSE